MVLTSGLELPGVTGYVKIEGRSERSWGQGGGELTSRALYLRRWEGLAEGDDPLLVVAEAGEVRKERQIVADGKGGALLGTFYLLDKHKLTVWVDV